VNHGTYFYHASQEGLLRNDTNIHAGIRTTLSGPSDYENDGYCGFEIVEAREIDVIGTDGIIKKILERVGTKNPVYLSLDIDTLDPACECFFLVVFVFSSESCATVCPLLCGGYVVYICVPLCVFLSVLWFLNGGRRCKEEGKDRRNEKRGENRR
jgi:hypothetical protein